MTQKLYRSRTDRMIGGICGGLGEFFSIDPVLVRLAFAFGAVMVGSGLVLYLLLWIIIPEEPEAGKESRSIFQNISENKDGTELKDELKEAMQDVTDSVKRVATEARNYHGQKYRSGGSGTLSGILLIAIGFLFLISRYIDIDFDKIWPIILIAIGFGLIIRSANRNRGK